MDRDYQRQQSHLFTVRMWQEELGEGQSEWRGKVQHVQSGEVLYFRQWSALVAALEKMLTEFAARPQLEQRGIDEITCEIQKAVGSANLIYNSSKKASVLLHTPEFLFDLYGKPYGVNYLARYSLCGMPHRAYLSTDRVIPIVHTVALLPAGRIYCGTTETLLNCQGAL